MPRSGLLALALLIFVAASSSLAGAQIHTAMGVVLAVDRDQQKVIVDAAPVPDLKLPALALAFQVPNRAILDKLRVGQRVQVEFIEQGRNFALTRVAPLPAPAKDSAGHESWGY